MFLQYIWKWRADLWKVLRNPLTTPNDVEYESVVDYEAPVPVTSQLEERNNYVVLKRRDEAKEQVGQNQSHFLFNFHSESMT